MTDRIRTRPDGSIDTAHYIAKGRNLRSQQAHSFVRPTPSSPAPRRGLPVLTVLTFAVLVAAALPFAA